MGPYTQHAGVTKQGQFTVLAGIAKCTGEHISCNCFRNIFPIENEGVRLKSPRLVSSLFLMIGIFIGLDAAAQNLPVEHSSSRATARVLDMAKDATDAPLERDIHTPLPEEYIWTATDQKAQGSAVIYKFPGVMEKTETHYFRHSFNVEAVPEEATLYIAGPRWAKIYINGQLVDEVSSDVTSPLGTHTFTTDVAKYLLVGKNTIAIAAIRGRGVTGFANSALVMQQTFGQVLVAKILPAARGVNAKAIMLTDGSWRSTEKAIDGWQHAALDDAGWSTVQSLGGIESSIELFQWNADAGLYDWPGYDGISPFLAHKKVMAETVLHNFEGRSKFVDLIALTGKPGEFGVKLAPGDVDMNAPSVVLDFGRELVGRLEVESDSDASETMTVQYGESELEMMRSPYLGVNVLTVAPHAIGHGPKTAFRYVKLRFISGQEMKFKSIHTDFTFYPVKYLGSFESSDSQLNRIWETGAYTEHLCMQDGVWDASKRDRGRWSGDNDVGGRVVNDVFGDHYLMEDTQDRLIGEAPVTQHVNGIPGYSGYWFTTVAEFYRHTGSKEFLEKTHDRAVQLLQHIDAEFDQNNLYVNKTNVWLYVDWSPELNGDTPESRRASELEFYRAYRDGAWLLREVGDAKNADFYEKRAAAIKVAANKYLYNSETGTYGPRWQTNAMAVLSGVAGPDKYPSIWKNVLSQVGVQKTDATHPNYIISPYYNYYVVTAMAMMGHQKEALTWIRQYWGGMIDEGATSFWEAYDPSWYKEDFHSSLQADNRSGYFVSLAHGWSSGPTAWLMEEMLGIHPTNAGFKKVIIAPDLMGVAWANGAEPTPTGLLKVDVRQEKAMTVTVEIPEGVVADVVIPIVSKNGEVSVNGKTQHVKASEDGTRGFVTLDKPGHYVVAN
jgi:alpha-L-rhamnosidase